MLVLHRGHGALDQSGVSVKTVDQSQLTFSLQSTDSGSWRVLLKVEAKADLLLLTALLLGLGLYPPMCRASNSAWVRSLNWFTPTAIYC